MTPPALSDRDGFNVRHLFQARQQTPRHFGKADCGAVFIPFHEVR